MTILVCPLLPLGCSDSPRVCINSRFTRAFFEKGTEWRQLEEKIEAKVEDGGKRPVGSQEPGDT